MPGHTSDSAVFVINTDGVTAICIGDMFSIVPCSPEDEPEVELGYAGSPDFNLSEYVDSLQKINKMRVDILLPGHGSCILGKVHQYCELALRKARKYSRDGGQHGF